MELDRGIASTRHSSPVAAFLYSIRRVKMRFTRRPRRSPRPITQRRLAISERTLRLQREALPLLATWVAEQQPSALERLEGFQRSEVVREIWWRKSEADTWKRARKLLRLLPKKIQAQILSERPLGGGPRHPCPKDSSYFANHVWHAVKPFVERGEIKIPAELDPRKHLEKRLLGHKQQIQQRLRR